MKIFVRRLLNALETRPDLFAWGEDRHVYILDVKRLRREALLHNPEGQTLFAEFRKHGFTTWSDPAHNVAMVRHSLFYPGSPDLGTITYVEKGEYKKYSLTDEQASRINKVTPGSPPTSPIVRPRTGPRPDLKERARMRVQAIRALIAHEVAQIDTPAPDVGAVEARLRVAELAMSSMLG